LANKFPELKSTLQEAGVSTMPDVEKLQSVSFTLPGLSASAGLSTVQPDIAQFTPEEKAKIPTEIVFARVGANKIDLNANVSISSAGEPVQSVSTVQSKPLNLVVKPDKPVKNILGYVVLKSGSSKSVSPSIFSASLLDAVLTLAGNDAAASNEVIVQQFQYTEGAGNDGIYTADINAPSENGKYEIRTVMNYKDETIKPKQIKLALAVDPQGYVYEKIGDKEARIKNAKVSLYWLNPETKQYQLWLASDFQQQNPQSTNITGEYSFLVPPGYYYIEVESSSYSSYSGKPFQIKNGTGVNVNVELKPITWWTGLFSIDRILMILAAAFIILLSVLIASVSFYFVRHGKLKHSFRKA
jgi:hypothetical protein